MMMMSRSLRVDEGRSSSWRRLQRSNSLLLASELAASDSEFAAVGSYQRLSQSMWVIGTASADSGSGFGYNKHRAYSWTGKLGKLFSFKRIRSRGETTSASDKAPEMDAVSNQAVKKKKRSSWLPDPDRRWPIQGW